MTPDQDFVKRLREATHTALSPHISSLEEELNTLQTRFSASFDQVRHRLTGLQQAEIVEAESILGDAVAAATETTVHEREQILGFLARFAHDLRLRETQEEILNMLLDASHRFAPRVALFVNRGEQFMGWSSRGYSVETAGKIANWSCPAASAKILREALDADGLTSVEHIPDDSPLKDAIGTEADAPWHVFPMKAIRRPVAVLLAAPEDGRSCDLETLCLLMDLTGLCVENIALKILQEMQEEAPAGDPVPAEPLPEAFTEEIPEAAQVVGEAVFMAEQGGDTAEDVMQEEHLIQEEVSAEESPDEPESASDETSSEGTLTAEQDEPAPSPEGLDAGSAGDASAHLDEPPAEPGDGVAAEEPPLAESAPECDQETEAHTGEAAAEQEDAREAPAEVAASEPEDAKTPVLKEVEPPSEEERLHNDARRFARLLVSEIKLYNEQAVLEGRANGDLYTRLKRDVDRSREMYEKRVAPVVGRRADYFHDEVIRILADNDPASLGGEYPGPRVQN